MLALRLVHSIRYCGGGLVVSVLTFSFYSNNPSSNPAEVYIVYNRWKRKKYTKWLPFFNNCCDNKGALILSCMGDSLARWLYGLLNFGRLQHWKSMLNSIIIVLLGLNFCQLLNIPAKMAKDLNFFGKVLQMWSHWWEEIHE